MEGCQNEIFGTLEPFFIRNIKFELVKNLAGIAEVKSEFMLFHMSNLRFGLLRYISDRNVRLSYVKRWDRVFNYINHLVENNIINEKYEILECYEITDNEFYTYLDEFMKCLLRYYKEDQLVFFDVLMAENYVNPSRTQWHQEERYEWVCKVNEIIKKANIYIRTNWPDCHFIEMPEPIIGWEGHKWGKYFTHFIDEYYEYAYAAINVVTKYRNSDRKSEKMELQVLKRKYDYIFYKCYADLQISGRMKNLTDMGDFEVLFHRLDKSVERWTWERYLRIQNKLLPEVMEHLDNLEEKVEATKKLKIKAIFEE